MRNDGHMATEDWPRLGKYVRDRRADLQMTQGEVQDAGGPSAAKIREIENGRTTTLSASKRRDLERALLWMPGGVDSVLAGQEPKPKRWRNEAMGLEYLIPTAPSTSPEEAEIPSHWPSELPAKVTGMYRSSRDALDAMERGDESDLVVAVTVAAVLAGDIMRGLGRLTDQVNKPLPTEERSNADLPADQSETTEPRASGAQAEVEKTRRAVGRRRASVRSTPDSDNVSPLNRDDPGRGLDYSESEDPPAAARRSSDRTKGEQIRERDAILGEESQVNPNEED